MSDNRALIAEARARAHRIIDANGGYMTNVPGDDHLLLRLADALVQADADTQRLRDALAHYGYHKAGCAYDPPVSNAECDCGLTALVTGDGKWIAARAAAGDDHDR